MRVCLHLDRCRVYRWHRWLAQSLIGLPDCTVSVTFASKQRPLPKSCPILLDLERSIYGMASDTAIDPIDPMVIESMADQNTGPYDIIIDLADDTASLPAGKRLLTPYYNGIPGEIGIVSAKLIDLTPMIEIHDSAYPERPWLAEPAVKDRSILLSCFDNILSCTVMLLIKAVTGQPEPDRRPFLPTHAGQPSMAHAYLRAATTLIYKVSRQIDKRIRGDADWAVAWRSTNGSMLHDGSGSYSVIPDDGNRFYADPFPFRHAGQDFIFVEEFPYDTDRGIISVAAIENGQAKAPVPVLEASHHLSYPFLFEHAGEIWMIPESGDMRGVDLYRAEKFPHRWKKEGRLLDIKGYDATLLLPSMSPDNRFWLFVCEKAHHSSTWDILSIFHADTLTGDWKPHDRNPVLIDAMLGRPAGAMFQHNGRIIRPVQDCSRTYGGRVHLCEITTLTPGEFAQRNIGTINAHPFGGCHTYNHHHGLEVIDVFGRRRDGVVTAVLTDHQQAFVNRVKPVVAPSASDEELVPLTTSTA